MTDVTDLGLPIGARLEGWTPPAPPAFSTLEGRTCRIERLDAARHGADLWTALSADRAGALWTYLPNGPFETRAAFYAFLAPLPESRDPLFYAVRPLGPDGAPGPATGFFSFLRIAPALGSIELGFITFSPAMQRTVAASEAMILMIRWAFEAGYRRFEWKCNALNAPSRRAAERLGLSFEGVFRQMQIVKGRNRDTAWFAAIDSEYPALRAAYESWLAPENFDAEGRQKTALSAMTAPLLWMRDPDGDAAG